MIRLLKTKTQLKYELYGTLELDLNELSELIQEGELDVAEIKDWTHIKLKIKLVKKHREEEKVEYE